eukprot:TRINITY_DN29330_c0_g1_i1.p1 TRINITY_DN29330_c0_g1~~TRINITY_DN29330_c0_g1_i1.p1  ORF type:complete len:354 (+),score=30.66 TRINITY_DN29330_c0_g1_i1:50-1063(+)
MVMRALEEWLFEKQSPRTVAGHSGLHGSAAGLLCYPSDVHVLRETAACLTFAFVAESGNHRVQRFTVPDDTNLESEAVIVAGGNGEGSRLDQLSHPYGLCVTPLPEATVYVADSHNHRVMRWSRDAKEGVVVAGGYGRGNAGNQLNFPYRVWVRPEDGVMFVSDSGNDRVMRYAPDGTCTVALSSVPGVLGLCGLPGGAVLTCDQGHAVTLWPDFSTASAQQPQRRITLLGNSKRAGTSPAHLFDPWSVAYDPNTAYIYVADLSNHRVQRIRLTYNQEEEEEEERCQAAATVVGRCPPEPGSGILDLSNPMSVHVAHGCLYVADYHNHRVQRIGLGA